MVCPGFLIVADAVVGTPEVSVGWSCVPGTVLATWTATEGLAELPTSTDTVRLPGFIMHRMRRGVVAPAEHAAHPGAGEHRQLHLHVPEGGCAGQRDLDDPAS